MAKRSAGLLLYRFGGPGVDVLLVHPGGPYYVGKDEGVWSVPKGEHETGDDPVSVALREFEEELGSAAPVERVDLVELGSVRQKGGKVVSAFCAHADFDATQAVSTMFSLEWPPRSGLTREFPEVDRADWFALAEARRKLVPAQAELVDRLEALLART